MLRVSWRLFCGLSVISVEGPSDNKMKLGVSKLASLSLHSANAEAGIQVAAYSQLTLYLTTTLFQSVHDALSTCMARQLV